MGARIKVNIGDKFNQWEVIETDILNSETKNQAYIGKNVFSKIKCTICGKTERVLPTNQLKNLSYQCNSCAIIARNIQGRTVQIGQVYGKLAVIGDAGYKERADGKRRHFSLCQCECGSDPIEAMDNILQGGRKQSCGCLSSKGELEIEKILIENNISYNKEVIFPELLKETGRKLRFDFVIYNQDGSLNRFIEFDGRQHSEGMDEGIWSSLEKHEIITERDQIKNDFCKRHNYILIRLPYTKLGKITIDDILG